MDRIFAILNKSQVAKLGERETKAWLQSELIPFFNRFTEISREGTITPSGDEKGNPGFAFHMVGSSPVGGEQLFVIYILEEDGVQSVGGVLPYERGEK